MEKIFPLHCGQCELSKVSPGPRVRQQEFPRDPLFLTSISKLAGKMYRSISWRFLPTPKNVCPILIIKKEKPYVIFAARTLLYPLEVNLKIMIYYGHEAFKIMTQMVQGLKCNIKEYSRMRTFLLSLIIFMVFLESIPAFALSNGWPVPYGSISSGIGWRKDPFGSGKLKWHNGIDIEVPLYTPVTPTGPGMIRYAGWHKDYGWLVVVDHHNGWFTMYGHNYTLAVKVGQEVTPATVISYAGSTGKSTGVHVHYEQRWYPEGATQAPVATEINNIREYSDREVQQPQGTSERSAEEIRQSAQASGQPLEEKRQPGFKSYNFTTPGGVGGE